MTGKENIISTIPQDPVYIASWEEVLNRSAILELPVNAKTLVDNVAQIGYENAISKSRYRDSILSYLNEWTRETSESAGTGKVQYANTVWQSLDADQQGITIVINYTSKWVKAISQETTDYLQRNVYNADISKLVIRNSAIERREYINMKRFIPISYVVLGVIFLSFSFIFGFTFSFGLRSGSFIVGPWTHLMLLLASIGLLATVVAAGVEWVKLQDVQQKTIGKTGKQGK